MHNFMPKPYKKEQITIRIDMELLMRIDWLAAGFHLSRSRFIAQCVDYAMTHMEAAASGGFPF